MASNANHGKYIMDDYVKNDGVVKEQVRLEEQTRRNYEKKWSYFTHFNELCLKMGNDKGISLEDYARLTSFKKGRRITSHSNWDIPKSPQVPTLTSGEVGWRSSQLECSLERLGPLYISPRHTLLPPGAEPEPIPTCIFLG
ncbi:hypothetical protein Trydic_g88 [Trypoxylus dichotomus]